VPWWEGSDSPTLRGNYAPVAGEVTAQDLEVEGQIPKALDGMFLRNGPNPQFEPPGRYHPFDGDGMVHAVTLKDGRASYKNRWVVSRQLAYERKVEKGLYGGMNNGFQPPEPEVIMRAGATKNVANINVVPHAGRLLAVSENGGPIALDYELNTLGSARFGGEKLMRYTGHPHKLPDTDELVGFAYSPFPPFFRYILADVDNTLLTNDMVDIEDPVMVHDLCIAGDFAVFLDAPAIFDLTGGASGKDYLTWRPERGTRFGVIPIHGRGWETRFFEADNCYIYHYYNGYQQGDTLVFYAECLNEMTVEYPEDRETAKQVYGYATRFEIDLKTGGKVKRTRVSEQPIVLPVVDPRVTGKPFRYGYAISFDDHDLDNWRYLVRHDFQAGTMDRYDFGEHQCVSEPSYVENPESPREEDGYLICYVCDKRTMTSSCQLLRAGALGDGPIAKIALPQRVPHGFHGTWLPSWAR
jgi:carotenoid cleavage dioxygenase